MVGKFYLNKSCRQRQENRKCYTRAKASKSKQDELFEENTAEISQS